MLGVISITHELIIRMVSVYFFTYFLGFYVPFTNTSRLIDGSTYLDSLQHLQLCQYSHHYSHTYHYNHPHPHTDQTAYQKSHNDLHLARHLHGHKNSFRYRSYSLDLCANRAPLPQLGLYLIVNGPFPYVLYKYQLLGSLLAFHKIWSHRSEEHTSELQSRFDL